MTWALDFWTKYILFELKKYRGVISHDIEEWCKIWRKTDLLLGKWHEEFGKFSPEYSKVSKLELWWDPFAQSRNFMTLKFTEELSVMKMKNDTKLKRNWLVVLKLTRGTSQILTRAPESLKHLCFNLLLATKVQRSYLSLHWRDMQILKKNWLAIWKKTWEIWQIFTRALESVKIGTLMDPLVQSRRSYVSWQWRIMHNLKRNWLVISKLTLGI